MKNPTTFEEFKKGTWQGEKIGDFAREDAFENYKKTMKGLDEAGKKATAAAHGFEYTIKKETKKKNGKEQVYVAPDKTVTKGPPDRAPYEGPAYYDPRTFDPTPSYMDLPELEPEDYVSNRMASFLNTGNPVFRQVSEAFARKMASIGGGRWDSRTKAGMFGEMIKVAKSVAEAEALMRERFKGKITDAFYKQMDIRMGGAMQQALTHISMEGSLTVAKWQDVTNQWKAQLAADIQAYGIDVGAAVSTYATKVQEALGMAGLDVKMADIMSKIEDNAEAASFIWDWIYGDNDLNPSEYHDAWVKKWGDQAGDDETTTTTDLNETWINAITNQLNAGNCAAAKITAENMKLVGHYNSIVNADGYAGSCSAI